MSTYIIYKTTNLVNGKIYVGQHNTSADDGYLGSGKLFQRALKKYGKEKFIRETIDFCTSANVNEKEIYWVDKLDATNPEVGYNIAKGGEGGNIGEWTEERKNRISSATKKSWTKERRKKFSEFRKGKYIGKKLFGEENPMFGKKQPNWWKKKMSEIRRGKKPFEMTDEVKKHMSKNHANVNGSNNPNFGKGKWQYIFIKPNGEIFKPISYIEFCKENNLSSITVELYSKKGKSFKGWNFYRIERS